MGINEATRVVIIKLHEMGHSYENISKTLGISEKVIEHICTKKD